MYNRLLRHKEDAVSPVVASILVVAITVALATTVGVFVFDLGESLPTSNTDHSPGVRTAYVNGEFSVQVISGESDELQILVNGSVEETLDSPSAGDSLTVSANKDADISVISVSDGSKQVVTNTKASSGGNSASTSTPTPTPTPEPNSAPTASASSDASLVNRGDSITFTGEASDDPDGDSLSYEWDFGDGNSADGETASHSYADPGTYEVTLTVDDGNGETSTATLSVTVEAIFYDEGTELVTWEATTDDSDGAGTTEKRADELYMYADAQTNPSAGRGFLSEDVDLTKVDTVYVEYTIDSRRSTMEGNNQTGRFKASLNGTPNASYSQEDVESYTHDGILAVDTSENSSGRIYLDIWAHSSNGGEVEVWVSRVWGE